MSRMVESIRDAIEASGRSQYELSAASGVSRGQLSRLMRGERRVGPESLEALADALGLEFVLRAKRRQRRKGGGR